MTVFRQSSETPQVDMGEASQAPSHPIQTLEPPNLNSSSSLSLNSAAASHELGLPFHNRRLRFRWNIRFRLVLASIASAAAVAALIAVCAAAYLRAAPLQLTRRMLSEGVSADSIKGLAACGDTSGNASGDDLQVSFREKELGPSPAKKVKVEDEGFEADGEAGSQPHASADSHDNSYIAAAGAAAIAPKVEFPLESRMPPKEVMAAQALAALWGEEAPAIPEQTAPGLALHGHGQRPPVLLKQAQRAPAVEQQARLASASQQQAQHAPGPQQQATAAAPLAFVSFPPVVALASFTVPIVISPMPLILSIPAGGEGPQPQPASVQLAAPRPEALPEATSEEPSQEDSAETPVGSRKIFLSSNEGLEVLDPLGAWEPPSLSKASRRAVVEHAFSRLPRVPRGDRSIYSSLFSPRRATSHGNSPILNTLFLRELSSYLAQEQVSPSQMRHLAALAERLVGHLTYNETRQPADWPAYAVQVLGFRFLLLDITVCTLQLLGVSCSGTWWDQMVSRIPDQNNRPFKKWHEKLPRFNANLMTRLTAAIRMLKTGRRPEPNVVVHIKRCLFCSRLSPIRFLKPVWDFWREEDRNFYKQFEETLGKSDQAQPGPSHQSAL
ncbi:hypothetical protein Emag_007048 [Eimeria magna]